MHISRFIFSCCLFICLAKTTMAQVNAQECSSEVLSTQDILAYFSPGAMKSKVFVRFEIKKKVRQCNTLTGCGPWSEAKANLKIKEILNSDTMEEVEQYLPIKGDAFFEISKNGELLLRFYFNEIDVYASPDFLVGSSKITFDSNDFFRKAPGYAPPMAGVSYFQNQEHLPFQMNGEITKNCFHLHSYLKVNREGISYDEFEIIFLGQSDLVFPELLH